MLRILHFFLISLLFLCSAISAQPKRSRTFTAEELPAKRSGTLTAEELPAKRQRTKKEADDFAKSRKRPYLPTRDGSTASARWEVYRRTGGLNRPKFIGEHHCTERKNLSPEAIKKIIEEELEDYEEIAAQENKEGSYNIAGIVGLDLPNKKVLVHYTFHTTLERSWEDMCAIFRDVTSQGEPWPSTFRNLFFLEKQISLIIRIPPEKLSKGLAACHIESQYKPFQGLDEDMLLLFPEWTGFDATDAQDVFWGSPPLQEISRTINSNADPLGDLYNKRAK